MDDLSKKLKECKTGCMVGESLINHLIYADDLVIMSPYSAGLQQLLALATEFNMTLSSFLRRALLSLLKLRRIRIKSFPHSYFLIVL